VLSKEEFKELTKANKTNAIKATIAKHYIKGLKEALI